MMVDPMKPNSTWIREGHDGDHLRSVERGREKNEKDMVFLASLLGKNTPQPTYFYSPDTKTLDNLPKFPSRRNGDCDVWRGNLRDLTDVGNEPALLDTIRRNRLPDVSKGAIERQMYRAERRVQERLLSKAGVPDYGIPTNGTC